MKHYGDITKINGANVEAVDVITGGSPCQDLSVAGKRAGLDGERSGLFMEQIRIIKEMRENDRANKRSNEHIRPRYMVWENVPGAFSSNKGEDFRVVLEETAKVADPNASVPGLEGGQRWAPSGCIMGDGWSIAWRVHDAQFWGVPQRRKRIALVADFGGASAPEILFERDGMPRDIAQSREERQGIADTPERNAFETISFQERAGCEGGVRESSYNTTEQGPSQPSTINQSCAVYNGAAITSPTNASNPKEGDPCHTLSTDERNYVICLQGNGIDRADTAGCNGKGWREDQSYTLNTIDRHSVCYSQDAYDKYSESSKAATIKQSGGIYGGGSEVLVTQ